MKARPLLLASALVTAVVIIATWPQAAHMTTQVAAHMDPEFSMWRIAWIAHALHTDVRHLFDANIFFPVENTLTYSDATLLEGVVAAPLFWAGVSPVAIYNVLLLGAMAASGMAMFVLARSVVGSTGPALIAAIVFAVAPYRIEHFMHLELQWAMWIPLTFWALHRALAVGADDRADVGLRWQYGILAGLFVWLQVVSCVYYGVFLALTLVLFAPLLFVARPDGVGRALPGLTIGALCAIVLTAPYALVYTRSAAALGPRSAEEIQRYSAHIYQYLISPNGNLLWGWTGRRWGGTEVNLFPGLVTFVLSLLAVSYRPRRVAVVYFAVTVFAIDMSLGTNGITYAWLARRVHFLQGLRAAARFSIIVCAAMAMLAAMGARVLTRSIARETALRTTFIVLITALILDYANIGMLLMPMRLKPMSVYSMMQRFGPGPVIELPLPVADKLPGPDPDYQLWSIAHWHPLINGYSGYYSPQYIRTLELMRRFPSDASMQRLRQLGTRYLIVHRGRYAPQQHGALLLALAKRSDLWWLGRYRAPDGEADLFSLRAP